jgi:hypothetical protein
MKYDTSKIKPFDLERAKAGDPVCTYTGQPVRILCWDLKNPFAFVIAGTILFSDEDTEEEILTCFNTEGVCVTKNVSNYLMMAPKTVTGFVNIYRKRSTRPEILCTHIISNVYENEEIAKNQTKTLSDPNYVTTVKIEWEE